MRRSTTIVAVVLATGIAVAACSGSSGKSANTAKAAYVQNANSVCDQVEKQLASLPTPGNPDKDPAQLPAWRDYLGQIIVSNQQLVDDLKGISPPPGDEAKINQFLDAARAHEDELKVAQDAAIDGDVHALDAAMQKVENDNTSFHDAQAYGLTRCAG
jgi:hypothetical protein